MAACLLFTSTMFYNISCRARAEIKSLRFLDKKVTFFFDRFFFICTLPFSPCSYLFAAGIDLLLSLLAVKKLLRKRDRDGPAIFAMEQQV